MTTHNVLQSRINNLDVNNYISKNKNDAICKLFISSGLLINYCQLICLNAKPARKLIFLNVDKTLKTALVSNSIYILLAKPRIGVDNGRIFNFTYCESFVMVIIFFFSLNIDGSKQSEKRNVGHAPRRLRLAVVFVFILLLPEIPPLISPRPCPSLADLSLALCRCSFLHVTQTLHMLPCFDFAMGEGKWTK